MLWNKTEKETDKAEANIQETKPFFETKQRKTHKKTSTQEIREETNKCSKTKKQMLRNRSKEGRKKERYVQGQKLRKKIAKTNKQMVRNRSEEKK